ncbi:hypothetical protein BJV82DRAFT_618785, partial [Fennellomyces sp. T-0311]
MNVTMQEQVPGRTCATSFVRGDTIFDKTDGSLIYDHVPQRNPGPRVSCSTAVLLPDNNTVLLFGGSSTDFNQTDNGMHVLLLYQYAFDSQTWTPLPVNVDPQANANVTALPRNRYAHTSTLASNGIVYIYGGSYTDISATFTSDQWMYDPTTSLFSPITEAVDNISLYGHCGIPLPNGIIWYGLGLFGYGDISNNGSTTLHLTEAEISLLYNTSDGAWSLQPNEIVMNVTSRKAFSSAVLGPDNRHIYSFGGSSLSYISQRLYRSSIDVLDTATWKYVVSSRTPIGGVSPSRREMAVSSMVLDNLFVVALGGARTQYYNDINVMELPLPDEHGNTNFSNLRWVDNIITKSTEGGKVSSEEDMNSTTIAAIIVPICIVAIIIAVLLYWRFRRHIRRLPNYVLHLVWKPRNGEPTWTEAISLAARAILTGAFIALLVFLIKQVLGSPSATVSTVQEVETVLIPDIRFCLNGYNNSIDTFEMSCITDSSVDCNAYLRHLDTEQHVPYLLSGSGHISCYLFSTAFEDWFQLAKANRPERNNGTKVHFTIFGTLLTESSNSNTTDSESFATHVSVYPPGRDPNIVFFGEDNASKPAWMTGEEFEVWLLGDSKGFEASNVFDLYPYCQALVQYQIENHEYLSNSSWNYLGIAPEYIPTPEVSITSRVRNNFRQKDLGTPGVLFTTNEITFMPQRYAIVNIREQRIHTLVNSLGFIGGIFGLFIAIHVLLFGSRPGSPWGIIQRWSTGRVKYSLYSALRSSYKTVATSIPFVSPVHPRFAKHSSVSDVGDSKEEIQLHDGSPNK